VVNGDLTISAASMKNGGGVYLRRLVVVARGDNIAASVVDLKFA
jgi:hypothetical protein